MTTRERTDSASPLEKFEILAEEIDQLRQEIDEANHKRPIEDLLEIIPVSELAMKYDVPLSGLKKKLILAGGEVFKIGKHSVIRKVKLLSVFESLEREMRESSELSSSDHPN